MCTGRANPRAREGAWQRQLRRSTGGKPPGAGILMGQRRKRRARVADVDESRGAQRGCTVTQVVEKWLFETLLGVS